MKKLNLLLLAFLVVMGVTLQSCDDSDGYSLGDVAVDWATVNVKGAHVYDFTGDRWGQIWPATTDYFWYSPIDGQRVILYFNPLYDNYPEGYDCSVKVLNIKEILTKPIEELTAENEEAFGNDPVDIFEGNMWISGGYLNIIFNQNMLPNLKKCGRSSPSGKSNGKRPFKLFIHRFQYMSYQGLRRLYRRRIKVMVNHLIHYLLLRVCCFKFTIHR